MFEQTEDLDTWFEDEAGSHWFRKLVFLIAGAAVAYYFARSKSRQLTGAETIQSAMPEPQVQVEDEGEPGHVVTNEEPLVDDQIEDESELEDETEIGEVETETVVDVIAAEFAAADDEYVSEDEYGEEEEEYVVEEYVIDDEEEITEDTEIDLALEEAIENGEFDDEELEGAELEEFQRLEPSQEDDNDSPLEGVLAETDDEDLEEQVLEPSPAPDEPPKWVAPVDGECPPGHPIKARFSTGRYHVPGDRGYAKIVPDCCYENTEDAKADGFTHSRWS